MVNVVIKAVICNSLASLDIFLCRARVINTIYC